MIRKVVYNSFSGRGLLLFVLILLILGFTGCGLTSDKSEFAGPDWSRGKLLGTANINNRPGIAWHPESKSAILIWLAKIDEQWHFQYARINNRGEIANSQALPLSLRQPSQPKLLLET